MSALLAFLDVDAIKFGMLLGGGGGGGTETILNLTQLKNYNFFNKDTVKKL
jgi:hypothetical protein